MTTPQLYRGPPSGSVSGIIHKDNFGDDPIISRKVQDSGLSSSWDGSPDVEDLSLTIAVVDHNAVQIDGSSFDFELKGFKGSFGGSNHDHITIHGEVDLTLAEFFPSACAVSRVVSGEFRSCDGKQHEHHSESGEEGGSFHIISDLIVGSGRCGIVPFLRLFVS